MNWTVNKIKRTEHLLSNMQQKGFKNMKMTIMIG